jgi:hypothetical protein
VTKSLCGYSLLYTNKNLKESSQIIISKNNKKSVLLKSLTDIGLEEICAHSHPYNNELHCATSQDYFSVIAKSRGERITTLSNFRKR